MTIHLTPPSPAAALRILNPNQAQQKPAATPAPQPASQQDTVQLSSQAKAAAGDVDHDGDSH